MKVRSVYSLLLILLCLWIYLIPALASDSFVTFTEYTEEGKTIPLSPNQFRYDVDLNSVIDVRFHPEVLSKYCLEANSTRDQLQREIDALRQLMNTSHDRLNTFAQKINVSFNALQTNPTPALEAEFRQQLITHGTLITSLLELLEPVVGLEKLDAALSTPDPSYADLFDLLGKHITDLQNRLTTETMRTIQENQLVINVWCLHYSGDKVPTTVHLNNYDTLEAGVPQMIDKVHLTPDDQEHLQASMDFYADLLKMTKDLQDHKGNLTELFQELKDQVLADLDKLKEPLQIDTLQQSLKSFQEEMTRSMPSTTSQAQRIKENVKKITSACQQLAELQLRYNDLLQSVRDTKNANPLQVYPTLIQKLDNFQTQLMTVLQANIADTIKQDAGQLKELLGQMGDTVSAALQDKVATLTQVTDQWAANFVSVLSEGTTGRFYNDLLTAMKSLGSGLSYTHVVTQLPVDNTIPEATQKVALDQALPTTIEIPRTLRQGGDTFTLCVQVYKAGRPLIREEYTFRVQPYGVYSTWKTGFIFVKNRGKEDFQPTTGLSWILHYRPRPNEGWYTPIFNDLLNLGIGLNSIMMMNNSQIQYGLGITATFLDDIVQIGYGINLQQSEKEGRSYFFIGASLLDLLKPTPELP